MYECRFCVRFQLRIVALAGLAIHESLSDGNYAHEAHHGTIVKSAAAMTPSPVRRHRYRHHRVQF